MEDSATSLNTGMFLSLVQLLLERFLTPMLTILELLTLECCVIISTVTSLLIYIVKEIF